MPHSGLWSPHLITLEFSLLLLLSVELNICPPCSIFNLNLFSNINKFSIFEMLIKFRVYSEFCTLEEISAGIELHYKQVVLKNQWIDESTTMITTKEGDFNFPDTVCALEYKQMLKTFLDSLPPLPYRNPPSLPLIGQ